MSLDMRFHYTRTGERLNLLCEFCGSEEGGCESDQTVGVKTGCEENAWEVMSITKTSEA